LQEGDEDLQNTDSPETPRPKGITISTVWVDEADGNLKTDKRKVASKKAEG